MDERELQAFLDQLMKESAEKRGVPLRKPEPAFPAADPPAPVLPEPKLPEPEPPEPELPEPELPEPELPEPELPEPEPSEPELPEPEPPEPELPEPADAVQPEAQRSHLVRDTVVGAILVMLSLIGIAALVQCGIAFGRRQLAEQPDTLPDELSRAVLPLVLIDQPDFDDPDALTDEQFLSAAVISLMTENRLADYPDNLGMRVIPAADITAAGEKLFGSARTPEYRTFGISGEVRCYYDKEQQSYLIPSPRLFTYEPKVTDYNSADGTVTAKVAYYAEQPAWQTGSAEYIKTVEYTLVRAEDAWQIRAVRQIA